MSHRHPSSRSARRLVALASASMTLTATAVGLTALAAPSANATPPSTPTGQYVYVNDSTQTNEVSAFALNTDGSLTTVDGSPFATGGSGYTSYFAAQDSTLLRSGPDVYVVNNADPSVTAMRVDRSTGALTVLGAPVVLPSAETYALAVAPNGSDLYAAGGGGSPIQILPIAADGSLGAAVASDTAVGGDGSAISPDGSVLAVADFDAVDVYPINSDGSLGDVVQNSIAADGITGVAFDPDAAKSRLFVGSQDSVSDFTLNNDGTLTAITSVSGDDPQDISVSNGGRTLSSTSTFDNSVSSYPVAGDGTIGDAVTTAPTDPGQGGGTRDVTTGSAFDSSDSYLYALNAQGAIYGYSVGSDSSLTSLGDGSPTVDGGWPDGYANSILITSYSPAEAVATVTAHEVYGGTPTFSVSGLSGDAADQVTGSLTGCRTSADDAVGTYEGDISGCSGLSLPDGGFIRYVSGTTTVTPAPLTVTAPSAGLTYGDTLPALNPSITGLVNNDAADVLGGVVCATPADNDPGAGTYPVTCSGVSDDNYSVNYVPGQINVAKAPLTVVAPSATIEHGDDAPDLTDPQYVGLVNDDDAPATAATCAVATNDGSAGTYAVTCNGAADANYRIAYQSGSLTITKADLTVVAPSATVGYGQNLPASLEPTYVSSDGNDPATPATCAYQPAGTPKNAGTYKVQCSGAADPNRRISYQSGTLTILPAPLVVSAPSPTITYGQKAPVVAPAYSGFVAADTKSDLTTPATCTSSVTGHPAAGSYSVVCSGAVDSNYSIAYAQGTLTVVHHLLLATPKVTTETFKAYKKNGKVLVPSYHGFRRGDTKSVLTTQPTCSATRAIKGPGHYRVVCRGGKAANYSVKGVPTQVRLT